MGLPADDRAEEKKIESGERASGGWLNEANILASSYPFVEVQLGSYIVPYNQLKEVVIEGKTAMSRKGSIKFVDAVGEWPDILMKIGADSNKVVNIRKPNLKITFGWKRLRGYYECLRSLDGMIIKSAIDLGDDGQVQISIEYIETVMSVTGAIRYLNPDDIEIIYRKKEEGRPKFEDMLVSEKLTWLTSWDNGTEVCKMLKDNKIRYTFEATNDDKEADLNVGFGDYLVDAINELTSKAKKSQETGKNYSYERGVCYYQDAGGGEYNTIIPYFWKAAPDETNTRPMAVFDNMTEGPVLCYKRTAGAGEKQILSFTSDLNSKTSLMMQSQDELNKKLMEFSEEDMEVINESIRENGKEGLQQKDQAGWFASKEKVEEVDRRNTARAKMDKIIQSLGTETASNQNSQLKAILANNVFKGTVKIMGDPTFGTDFEPWKMAMKTNFTAVGGFGATFGNRTWALTYVKHTFSEGSFETELEMLTYPQPDDRPATPAAGMGDFRAME